MTAYEKTLVEDQLCKLVKNAADLTEQTKKIYYRVIASYIEFVFDKQLDWKTSNAVQAYYNAIREPGGVKTQTANGRIFALRRVFEMLSREPEFYLLERIADLDLIEPEDESERTPLEEGEAQKLLLTTKGNRSIRNIRDRALLVVGLETGMRRMSLAGMEWERIEWSIKMDIKVGAVNVPIKGRGGKKRHLVPLSEVALRALLPWQEICRKQGKHTGHVFKQIKEYTVTEKMYPIIGNAKLSNDAIYEIIKKRAKQAGMKTKAHELRHTYVDWRRTAGVADASIATVTGHAIPDSKTIGILDVYSHIGVARAAIAATPVWMASILTLLEDD